MTGNGERLAEILRKAGYEPDSVVLDIHPQARHAAVTRRCAGGRGRHRTILPIDAMGLPTPAQVRDLHAHGLWLDAFANPIDMVRVANEAYAAILEMLDIRDQPGYCFSPDGYGRSRPHLSVRIADNEWERSPLPLSASFSIVDPMDPVPWIRDVAAEIRRRRSLCASEAKRQEGAPRVVERSAAVILAHALQDEERVVEALRSPAAWPRIVQANDMHVRTDQDNHDTVVPGLTNAKVRVSAKHAWLVTNGPLPGGMSWNGTTFRTSSGTGLSQTVLSAIVGNRLSEVVDHPWLRGIDAPITKASSAGKGGHAKLNLRTAWDRIGIDEAREVARRVIGTYGESLQPDSKTDARTNSWEEEF